MAALTQRKLFLYVVIAALLSLVIWVQFEWLLPGTKVDSTNQLQPGTKVDSTNQDPHPQGVSILVMLVVITD